MLGSDLKLEAMADVLVNHAVDELGGGAVTEKHVRSDVVVQKGPTVNEDFVNGDHANHGAPNLLMDAASVDDNAYAEEGSSDQNNVLIGGTNARQGPPDGADITARDGDGSETAVTSSKDVDVKTLNGEPRVEENPGELPSGQASINDRVGSGEAFVEVERKEKTGWGFGQSSSSTWSSISEPGSGRPPGLLPGSVSQEDEQGEEVIRKGAGTSAESEEGDRQVGSGLASSSGTTSDLSGKSAVVDSGLSRLEREGSQRIPWQSKSLLQRHGGWIPGKRYPDQDDSSLEWRNHKKHILVLSNAGKPIYSRYGDELKLAGLSATIQAIMSFVENRGDQIHSVSAGLHQIVFLVRGPLYLISISATDEPVAILKRQLELLHGQMISILTTAVEKCFTKNPKFDMRPLLLGTEGVLSSLVHAFSGDWATFLCAYTCLPLSYHVRQAATSALQEANESGLLFGLLISGSKVISLVTPRKTPMHPDDILMVTNLVSSSDSFRTSESFLPVCLPIFSPNAFLYAYINYLRPHICLVLITSNPDGFYTLQESRANVHDALVSSGALDDVESAATCGGLRVEFLASNFSPTPSVSSLHTSASTEWGGMQIPTPPPTTTAGRADASHPPHPPERTAPVPSEGTAATGSGEEGVSADGVAQMEGGGGALSGPAGLWHFVYRSAHLSQYVASEYAGALGDRASQKRLFRAYERVYASVHGMAGAGGAAPFRMQYRREEEQVIFAWRTADFELYAAFDPLADKASAIAVCNRVTQWLRDLECDYFLLGSLHW